MEKWSLIHTRRPEGVTCRARSCLGYIVEGDTRQLPVSFVFSALRRNWQHDKHARYNVILSFLPVRGVPEGIRYFSYATLCVYACTDNGRCAQNG